MAYPNGIFRDPASALTSGFRVISGVWAIARVLVLSDFSVVSGFSVVSAFLVVAGFPVVGGATWDTAAVSEIGVTPVFFFETATSCKVGAGTGITGSSPSDSAAGLPNVGGRPQTGTRVFATRGAQCKTSSNTTRMYKHPRLSTYVLALKSSGGSSAGLLSPVMATAI